MVDVFAAFYVHERDYYMGMGVLPTLPTIFSPAMLVTEYPQSTTISGWWKFSLPYVPMVWVLLVVTGVFNGICFAIVMREEKDKEVVRGSCWGLQGAWIGRHVLTIPSPPLPSPLPSPLALSHPQPSPDTLFLTSSPPPLSPPPQ